MHQELYDRTVNRIRSEAIAYVGDAQKRFVSAMRQAEALLPDKNDRTMRVTQLDIFIEATVGFLVATVSTYANHDPKTEELIVAGVKRKFQFIRDQIEGNKKGPDQLI